MLVSRPSARVLLVSVALLVVLSWIARIVHSNYNSVIADFEPFPGAPISKHPDQVGIGDLKEVTFRSSDGTRLGGWYVPSRNGASVIVTHGTGSDRSTMLAELRILSEASFGVLAFDWPGNGASEGDVRWNIQERQALSAAIDWLSRRRDVVGGQVGGLGFSMGGYIMAQVAAKDTRLRAIVLLATPSDYAELTHWQHRKWGWLSEWPAELALRRSGMPTTEQRPVDVVGEIAPRPLAVVRGDADDTVPEFMTRSIYAAARAPKALLIIPGAKHGGYAQAAPDAYRSWLVRFFTTNLL